MERKKRRTSASHNERMKDGNPYKHTGTPDLLHLAQLYPEGIGRFVTTVNGYPTIDRTNPEAMRELTKTLLLKDFSLVWDIPLNTLCPPVPNRVNYICWLKELISLGSDPTLTIIDIGVGASCIYPLLGAKMHDWHFIGTDIDPESVACAISNVAANSLQTHIQILQVEPSSDYQSSLVESHWPTSSATPPPGSGPIATAINVANSTHTHTHTQTFGAVMCNPPFYSSEQEVVPTGFSTCSGRPVEMITQGGELGFVMAMIADSITLREKVVWYTCMVGKKSTLRGVLKALRVLGIRNVRSTTFFQGRTIRWAVAWSFTHIGEDSITDEHKVFASKKRVSTVHDLKLSISREDVAKTLLPEEEQAPVELDDEQHLETETHTHTHAHENIEDWCVQTVYRRVEAFLKQYKKLNTTLGPFADNVATLRVTNELPTNPNPNPNPGSNSNLNTGTNPDPTPTPNPLKRARPSSPTRVCEAMDVQVLIHMGDNDEDLTDTVEVVMRPSSTLEAGTGVWQLLREMFEAMGPDVRRNNRFWRRRLEKNSKT